MRTGFEKEIEKPWGKETVLHLSPQYCFKKIEIKKGYVTSLQYHRYKKETIYVVSGKAYLRTTAEFTESKPLVAGDVFTVAPGDIHRLEAIEDLVVLEASTSEVWDVVRIEDAYGRQGTDEP